MFDGPVHPGMLSFGFLDKEYNGTQSGNLLIKGTLLVKGCNFHCFGVGIKLKIEKGAIFEIGDCFSVSANAKIIVSKYIRVGDDNMWSFYNIVMDCDSHQILDKNGVVQNFNMPVVFGNHIWMGCRNIVLKNTVIADGCIVASGSIINKAYNTPNCIISSHGKIIKQHIRWKRDWSINE